MTYEESVKRYENFVRLQKKGATQVEIAKMYGISRQAVSERLKKGKPKINEYFGGILGEHGLGHLTGRDRARMLVRIRDGFTCQDCDGVRTPEQAKKTGKRLFDVHHTHGQCGKNSRGYDPTGDISRMITLCHKCHFNRPEHSVKKHGDLSRRITKEKFDKEFRPKVLELAKFGMKPKDIAFNIGISYLKVKEIIKEIP